MNPLLRLAALASHLLPAPLMQSIYRIQPLARLVRRTLNLAAPTELAQVKIAAALIGPGSGRCWDYLFRWESRGSTGGVSCKVWSDAV